MIFEHTIIPWVGKTGKLLGCFINERFQAQEIPLTREQWVLLIKLSDFEGVPQHDLAFITERDKTSLTRLIQTMEKKGFVKRKPDPKDRRVNLVFMTEKGNEVYQKSLPVMETVIDLLQKNISEEEIVTTIKTLQKLQTNIREFNQIKR
ncbi:MarR family winged helix-turn-helix transcriptional regulator [Aureivirga sp. CE67]|uniref:MarR family winged helix-turn-helix transcriptional regulator n=1 Tax=Aureivirga sp. CE67 TaxID=1788983 RepID=UPI0018CA2D34|nr:MarR family transcriptional regulator [Aureivirga sp. CE67]